MLDENLPTFFLKPSAEASDKYMETFHYSIHGDEPQPAYTLKHPDPSSSIAANRYGCALFDAYNPDVLFGEVMIVPEWTLPTLSADEIRRNGGIPPPPQPITPGEFVIQLYNPEQQVTVTEKVAKWTGATSYEFSLPISTFRTPSASTLDRGQNDPAVEATTPKVNLVWRRESKLSKDMTCYMTGKSTDVVDKKRKNKEPDIAMALFRSMREMTIYEPNLYRVEMEDPKGLEVVLLLGAAVIRDIYFKELKNPFNIADSPDSRKNSAGRKTSLSPTAGPLAPSPPPRNPHPAPLRPMSPSAAVNGLYKQPQGMPSKSSTNLAQPTHNRHHSSLPRLQTTPTPPARQTQPPPPDPRTQYYIDAETQRPRLQAEAEAQAAAFKAKERQKQDEAEQKRILKMLEQEERAERKRREKVERETAELRRKYGVAQMPNLPQGQVQAPPRVNAPGGGGVYGQGHGQSHSVSNMQLPFRPAPAPMQRPAQNLTYLAPQRPVPQGPYLQPPGVGGASSSTIFGTSTVVSSGNQKLRGGKKSFWGLRSASESGPGGGGGKLVKKQSSMF